MSRRRPYRLLTDELADWLADEATPDEQNDYLVLVPHPESPDHWLVESFDPGFIHDFEPIIGGYRAVGLSNLESFLGRATELKYHVVYEEDPAPIIEREDRLAEPPPFSINSTFEGTTNGFLPFQLRGFNYLKDKRYGLAVWSTGTGKTILASALIRHHSSQVEGSLYVVKAHNKINTQRKLLRLGDVEGIVVTGPKKSRQRAYGEFIERMDAGEAPTLILNYEKFRDDFVERYEDEDGVEQWRLTELGERIFPDRKLLFLWDEMPMKLKSRSSLLYKSVCRCLYSCKPPQVIASKVVPAEMWHYMFSATPIEQDPEDMFNCVRLMDKAETFGTVGEFRDVYVKRYSWFDPYKPEAWHNTDLMHLKISHFTHVVDRNDPEVAAMFPRVIEEAVAIEWDPKNRRVYEAITARVKEELENEEEKVNPLSLMTVLQMYCDLPSMINLSAANRDAWERELEAWADSPDERVPPTKGSDLAMWVRDKFGELDDKDHEKLAQLKELLEKWPDEKKLVYCAFNDLLIPPLSRYLDGWGVNHVIYNGTNKQKQAAQDAFTHDPDVKLFLSPDSGSDSIDLDVASVLINYDLPWHYARKAQRRGRFDRVSSQHETIYSYTLVMEKSVEDRRVQRIAQKLGYHEGVLLGVPEDEVKSLRMTQGDLWYILTGYDPS